MEENVKIKFKWLGGGSWLLMIDSLKIICDPVLCPLGSIHDYRYFKSKRINPPYFEDSDLENVSIWLFTHGHKDHCDFGGYRPIATGSSIVADRSAKKALIQYGYKATSVLGWSEKAFLKIEKGFEVTIEAVPAIHGLNTNKGKLVGNGNGYWIEINHLNIKYTLYTSGDTLLHRDTINAIQNRSCDLFIANVGNATVGRGLLAKFLGRITMNITDASLMQKHFTPQLSIPIHWDAFEHYQQRDISGYCGQNHFRHLRPGDMLTDLKKESIQCRSEPQMTL